jgi:hypothetical protein
MGMPFMAGVDIMACVAVVVAYPFTRELVIACGEVFGLLPAFVTVGIALNPDAVVSVLVATLECLGAGRSR